MSIEHNVKNVKKPQTFEQYSCVFGLFSQVSTAEDNGIFLYNGVDDHIAVELHDGRVKVTYDAGNQPESTIYRFTLKTTLHIEHVNTPAVILCLFPQLGDSERRTLSHRRAGDL